MFDINRVRERTVRILWPGELHLVLVVEGKGLRASGLKERRVLHPSVILGDVGLHVWDKHDLRSLQTHTPFASRRHLSPTAVKHRIKGPALCSGSLCHDPRWKRNLQMFFCLFFRFFFLVTLSRNKIWIHHLRQSIQQILMALFIYFFKDDGHLQL